MSIAPAAAATAIYTEDPRWDILLIRGNATKPFGRWTAPTSMPRNTGLGECVREAFAAAADGDMVMLGNFYPWGALLDASAPLIIGKGVSVTGLSPKHSYISSQYHDLAADYCSFALTDRNTLTSVGFRSAALPTQQAAVIGWSGQSEGTQAKPSNAVADLIGCEVSGGNFGAYIWGGYGNLMRLWRCIISFARWGVTCGCSGGPDAAYIDAHYCTLMGDSSLSTYQGRVGKRIMAFAGRGGVTRATHCDSYIKAIGMDLAAGIWTPSTDTTNGDYEAAHPATKMFYHHCTSKVASDNDKWADVWQNAGSIEDGSCVGSYDGRLRYRRGYP